MAIGRTFKEAFQKGLRALEIGPHRAGRSAPRLQDDRLADETMEALRGALRQPTPERVFQVKRALRARASSIDELYELTAIDPWFLAADAGAGRGRALVRGARRAVGADEMRAHEAPGLLRPPARRLRGETEDEVRARRWALGVRPAYKMVDTCAGEFPSSTPYLYGSYDEESEAPRSGPQVGRHPRQRPESHRAGRGVRLLLRARGDGAARAGVTRRS